MIKLDKWCIRRTPDNADTLDRFRKHLDNGSYIPSEKCYFHYPNFEIDSDGDKSWWCQSIKEGYTEITLDQFIQLPEVSKWHRHGWGDTDIALFNKVLKDFQGEDPDLTPEDIADLAIRNVDWNEILLAIRKYGESQRQIGKALGGLKS